MNPTQRIYALVSATLIMAAALAVRSHEPAHTPIYALSGAVKARMVHVPTPTPTTPQNAPQAHIPPSPATPAPAVVARVPEGRDHVVERIRATFPDDAGRAVIVAYCESRLNPASGPSPTNDYGLFQFNRPTWADEWEHHWGLGTFIPNVYDLELNLRAARILYDAHGWSHWSCRPGSRAYAKAAGALS